MSDGRYYVEDYHDGYMVKLDHDDKTSSLQWFWSHSDADTFMFLLRYGVAPWTAYQLVMGEPSNAASNPTTDPPHEKTYRERFGS